MVYYPPPTSPYIFTCSHYFRTIFKKKNQNESWTNPLTHFQSYLAFFEFFLTLLVIKINFFLEYSCFCIFCAEDDPGTTQKKWQQRFSRLDMYFGGNNHGCQEYSKNVYKYTQADRLYKRIHDAHRFARYTGVGVHLLQHLVDVDAVALPPFSVSLLVTTSRCLRLADGLLGALRCCFGRHDFRNVVV